MVVINTLTLHLEAPTLAILRAKATEALGLLEAEVVGPNAPDHAKIVEFLKKKEAEAPPSTENEKPVAAKRGRKPTGEAKPATTTVAPKAEAAPAAIPTAPRPASGNAAVRAAAEAYRDKGGDTARLLPILQSFKVSRISEVKDEDAEAFITKLSQLELPTGDSA